MLMGQAAGINGANKQANTNTLHYCKYKIKDVTPHQITFVACCVSSTGLLVATTCTSQSTSGDWYLGHVIMWQGASETKKGSHMTGHF
jgi:hypothetical protein